MLYSGSKVLSLFTTSANTIRNPSAYLGTYSYISGTSYVRLPAALSNDNGQTWQQVTIAAPGYGLQFYNFIVSGDKFYIMGVYEKTSGSSTVYKPVIGWSTDGTNWSWIEPITSLSFEANRFETLMADKNGTTLYLVGANTVAGTYTIRYSNNSGITWDTFTLPTFQFSSVVPGNNGIYVFYSGVGNSYFAVPDNPGNIRRFSTLPLNVNSTNIGMAFAYSNNNLVIYLSGSLMYYSADNGVTWTSYTMPSSLPTTASWVMIYGNQIIWSDTSTSSTSSRIFYTALSNISKSQWGTSTILYSSYLTPFSNSTGKLAFYQGAQVYNLLEATPATSSTYYITPITAPYAGSKWVIKAK